MAKKFRKKILLALILASVILLVATGFYSYRRFKESGFEEEGFVVCNKEDVCEKSVHIHATLNVSICGENKNLPKETGRLNRVHTHKEQNLLHFHERLRVSPQTQELINPEPLTIKAAIREILKIELPDQCPDGKPGKLKLTVNGEPQGKIPDYVWKDGDKIELTFN